MLKSWAKKGSAFIEGNAKILNEYLQKQLGKNDLKVAIFGSNYLWDLCATHEFNQRLLARGLKSNWHSVILKEELRKNEQYYFVQEAKKIARNIFPTFSSDLETVL